MYLSFSLFSNLTDKNLKRPQIYMVGTLLLERFCILKIIELMVCVGTVEFILYSFTTISDISVTYYVIFWHFFVLFLVNSFQMKSCYLPSDKFKDQYSILFKYIIFFYNFQFSIDCIYIYEYISPCKMQQHDRNINVVEIAVQYT